MLAAQKMTIIFSFQWDSSVLTTACTAGTAAVCKDELTSRDVALHLVHVQKERRAGTEDEIGVDCP